MKYIPIVLFASCLFAAGACNRTPHEHTHTHNGGDSTNEALNEKVLGIHDEVMEKGNDLYRFKKKYQDSLAGTKGLSPEKRAAFEGLILSLDSAQKAMNKWMHEFNPNKDSADQEKTREYFETEIEKITKIKVMTDEVIERAKGEK